MDNIFELDENLNDYGVPIGPTVVDEVILEGVQSEVDNDSFISAQTFEINETNKYTNVKYKIYDAYTNKLIKEIDSIDGFVKFVELNRNRKYNITVEDAAFKYSGKFISDISPSLDLEKSLKIIKISDTKINNKYTLQFKIVYNGEAQVNMTGPSELSLKKITNEYYEISGIINSDVFNFEIYLDDYVEDSVYRITKMIKYGE